MRGVTNTTVFQVASRTSSYDTYRGALRIGLQTTAPLASATNEVTLERYLRGVVPAEMPSTWPVQALRAQAIAARSFAARRLRPGVSYFDVPDDSTSQVYLGVLGEKPTTTAAVADTAGIVLKSGSSIANTLFHSTGGGATEHNENVYVSATGAKVAGPVSYLRGSLDRRADGTAFDSGSPYATWKTATYTRAQLSAWFGRDSRTNVGSITALDLGDRGVSGRLISVTLIGSGRDEDRVRRRCSARCSTPTDRRATRRCAARCSTSSRCRDRATMTDEVARCWWSGADGPRPDPGMVAYHDDEWGVPTHDDTELFERLALESFQAGLSWSTILNKRDTFRAAFRGFDPRVVAGFDDNDRARLMADAGIVRNRAKIDATIGNAAALLATAREFGSFDAYLASMVPGPPARLPSTAMPGDIPATTPASDALSRDLKRRGFRFVGSTIVYAFMQSVGLVDDHLPGCFRYGVTR